MKLTFITSGKIDYTLPGCSLYESIRLTSLGEKFPHLSESDIDEVKKVSQQIKAVQIISAPSEQCVDTAEIIANETSIPVKKDNNLLPLRFDITKLMSEDEFNELEDRAFDILRKRFLEAFYQNKLLDNNQEVKKRITNFQEGTLFVSHAFLIKLFEVYSKIGDQMYKDKSKLFKAFAPQRAPYKRLEIVTITL